MNSDDDVEVLDLTTPLPPAPRSRTATSARATTAAAGTAAGTAASSPTNAPGGSTADGWRNAAGEGNDVSSSDDDLFSIDYTTLRERLNRKTATPTATCAAGRGTATTAAASAAANGSQLQHGAGAVTSVLDSSTPGGQEKKEEEEDNSELDEGSKGKGKTNGRAEALSGGCTFSGSSSSRDEMEEEKGYTACTQDNIVVELLSDSDDEGGVVRGRSQLWSRASGGCGGGGSASPRAGARARIPERPDLGESDDSESAGEESEPLAGTQSSDLGLDALVLASETSSNGISSPPRAWRGTALDGGSGGGSRTLDESDDEFFIPGDGGGGGGRRGASSISASRGTLAGGGGAGVVGAAAAASRQKKASTHNEETANRKRQRDENAAAEKQRREQEKLARKREKELAKHAETAKKAARRELERQARGTFKFKEVACVMERTFFNNPRNASARSGASEQPGQEEKFLVAAGDCGAAGAVWWTRRAYLEGRAAVSGPGVKTLDILVVVVPPDTLLGCLDLAGEGRGGVDGNMYPVLGQFVDGIRRSAPGFGRLVLVLEGAKSELDRQWAALAQSTGKAPAGRRCKNDVFEDAQCWLLIHKEVETRLTKDGEETGQYLWGLTKAFARMPYEDDVTELHCVPRSKAEARGSERFPKAEKELMDTWVKMLEQVHLVSSSRAVEIAAHYPLPRDLVAALSDPAVPETERKYLLTTKMGGTSDQRKISSRIFQLFTQEDGDFVID